MFKALEQRNYRLYFFGMFVSALGSWVSNTAMGWLVYSLTNSALLMGLITFINMLPSLLLMPFAGVIIDKLNQYKMMIFLQTMLMFWAIILSTLTLLGIVEVWHIIVLGLFANSIMAFDMPLRQAFVVKLIEKKELLSNAISLNSINFNIAKLLGPAIAGVLIAKFSEGICFLLNGISFIAVIIALLLMNISNEHQNKKSKISYIKEIAEGIKYVKNNTLVKYILLFLVTTSFTAGIYSLITPIYVNELLSKKPEELGYLMTCLGIGSVLGSFYLASLKNKKELLNQILIGATLFSFSFLFLSFIHVLWIDMIIMFISGIGLSFVLIGSNTSIQNVVENEKRGRVMSFYSLTFFASVPVGHLVWGFIIDKIGLANALFCAGIYLLSATIIFSKKFSSIKKNRV